MRKSYGFRAFRVLELALYHSLGKLPEPESTHEFFWRTFFFAHRSPCSTALGLAKEGHGQTRRGEQRKGRLKLRNLTGPVLAPAGQMGVEARRAMCVAGQSTQVGVLPQAGQQLRTTSACFVRFAASLPHYRESKEVRAPFSLARFGLASGPRNRCPSHERHRGNLGEYAVSQDCPPLWKDSKS